MPFRKCPLEKEQSCNATSEYDEYGICVIGFVCKECECKYSHAYTKAPGRFVYGTEVFTVHEQKRSSCKKPYYCRPKSFEYILHNGMILVFHQELANSQHQDEAWEYYGKGGYETAKNSPIWLVACIYNGAVAYICSAVYSYWPWSTLADCYDVGELSHCHPVVIANNFTLDHGDHSVSTSEAKETNLEECPEDSQKH